MSVGLGSGIDAFEAIAKKHGALVRRIANRLGSKCPPNVEVDDLVQVGMIALWKSTSTYDSAKADLARDQDEAFVIFASARIRGAMLDELRSMDTLSRRDRSLNRKLRSLIEGETGQEIDLRRLPTHAVSHAAEILNICVDDAHRILLHSNGSRSFDPLTDDDGTGTDGLSPSEVLSTASDAVEQQADVEIWKDRLPSLFKKLDEREQAVLQNWLDDAREQNQLSDDFKVTESRISQIKKRILAELPKLATKMVVDEAAARGELHIYPSELVSKKSSSGAIDLRRRKREMKGPEWTAAPASSDELENVRTVEELAITCMLSGMFGVHEHQMQIGPGTRWG